MVCNKISHKTISRAEYNNSLIGLPAEITLSDRFWFAKRDSQLAVSFKIAETLLPYGTNLYRQKLTAKSKLTGKTRKAEFLKDSLFLPCAAAKIRGDEARHLACWAIIASGEERHQVHIKADVCEKKWGIKLGHTFGRYKQNFRYAVINPGVRCGVEDFEENRLLVERKIRLFNAQPGVKVQFWSIEYTILHQHDGKITFNIHGNVLYTLDKKYIGGFRERIKRDVCPNEYWHDRGEIDPHSADVVARYVNKAEAKANKEALENSEREVDDEGYTIDGKLIDIEELCDIDSETLNKLCNALHGKKMVGKMNEYKKFRKMLNKWSLRVVVVQHRLYGFQYEFMKISQRLTVAESLARDDAKQKAEKAEIDRKNKQKEEKVEAIAAIKEEQKTVIKELKAKYKEVHDENKRDRDNERQAILSEADNKGGRDANGVLNDYYKDKLRKNEDFYNSKTHAFKRETKIKKSEVKLEFSFKLKEKKAEVKARHDEENRKAKEEQKPKPRAEKIGGDYSTNVPVFSGNVFKNEEIGVWDQEIFIKNYDEEKFYRDYDEKNAVYDKKDRENVEKCRSIIEYASEPLRRNGWDFKEKKNSGKRRLGSGQFVEAVFNSYFYKLRNAHVLPRNKRFGPDDLKTAIARFRRWEYDPSDWINAPKINYSDEYINEILDYITDGSDSVFRNCIATKFLYSRLEIINKKVASPAVNWDKFDFSNETIIDEIWPVELFPEEDIPPKGYHWNDPPPPDVKIDDIYWYDPTEEDDYIRQIREEEEEYRIDYK